MPKNNLDLIYFIFIPTGHLQVKFLSMRCLWFRFYYFFSEIGLGWMPDIMNSEAERDYIKDSQRLLSDVRTYWIGGSIPDSGASNFSSYIPRQPVEG